jgi:hypothetical protein
MRLKKLDYACAMSLILERKNLPVNEITAETWIKDID